MSASKDGLPPARVDAPYPTVTITSKNYRYAAIVSDAYSGAGSEMTAIGQYAVHRFYLKSAYPISYQAYEDITLVEQLHWNLLGDLILPLGRPPVIRSYVTGAYWSGRFPVYRSMPQAIFQSDIDGENAAIAHYQRMIRMIENTEMQSLFRRIILDEQRHIEILKNLQANPR